MASCASLCALNRISGASRRANVDAQPFFSQIQSLLEALELLGEPLSTRDRASLSAILTHPERADFVTDVEAILDSYVLLNVTINPESRVSARRGNAMPILVQHGWKVFLVKVDNQGGVSGRLQCVSPQALADSGQALGSRITPTGIAPQGSSRPVQSIRVADVMNRWLALEMFDKVPLSSELSGLPLEYRIIELYSRDNGQRQADISFNVGPATADIGFRNSVAVLFTARPANRVRLNIVDFDGTRTTAALTITDVQGRIYPCRSKRLAPDFPFQKQIYRADGQSILLPAGTYAVVFERGPEYIPKSTSLVVTDDGISSVEIRLERWINPMAFGWYPGDHHVHAAGCAHYNTPTDGVLPSDMAPQVLGEGLSFADILTWGPCWYYQKGFFRGHVDPVSNSRSTLRYDVEVSGFPSSYWGHLVLLQLQRQDFPGTREIEDWPTWNLPILQWAKSQGAVTGYAHTGHGLTVPSNEVPNVIVPEFNDNGANEFLIDVTHGLVDFLSAVDTPALAELNLWYHVLNCGFEIPLAGETDFPCLSEKIGVGRSYVHLSKVPIGDAGYRSWIAGLKAGKSYVSDGRSHVLEMTVNSRNLSDPDHQIAIDHPSTVTISARVAAYLTQRPSEASTQIRNSGLNESPYWHVERCRRADSRRVQVELIANGRSVASKEMTADGTLQLLSFQTEIVESSWVALRIFPSCHSNPMFIRVGGKPVRASRQSAQWCMDCIHAAWGRLSGRIASQDQSRAKWAMKHASEIFHQISMEARST